jgi:hypothetical protein
MAQIPGSPALRFSFSSWHSYLVATIAFLPETDCINTVAAQVSLSATPLVITPPSESVRWVTHVASQLASTAEPLILVFHGEASVHAPAIGFSRRSLRRPAVGYILIDPIMPTIGGDYGDWPDAPVTVVITDEANDLAKEASLQSRLRGWKVTTNSPQEVLSAL